MSGIEDSRVEHQIDTDLLPVAVHEECYQSCRKLGDMMIGLVRTAETRNSAELALICEGKSWIGRCNGVVVRTGDLTTKVSGPNFGRRNAEERALFEIAVANFGSLPVEAAFNKVEI